MQNYLTPEDIKTAEANGINYNNVYSRFYSYGWSKEDAITKPVKKRNECPWYQYKELAEQHSVSYFRWYDRVYKYGMDPKEAATKKVVRGGLRRKVRFTPEILARAAANGVSKETLKHRIYVYKWDFERAVNTPVDKSKRRKDYETTRIGRSR